MIRVANCTVKRPFPNSKNSPKVQNLSRESEFQWSSLACMLEYYDRSVLRKQNIQTKEVCCLIITKYFRLNGFTLGLALKQRLGQVGNGPFLARLSAKGKCNHVMRNSSS